MQSFSQLKYLFLMFNNTNWCIDLKVEINIVWDARKRKPLVVRRKCFFLHKNNEMTPINKSPGYGCLYVS